jgi:Zinc knuckle
MAPNTRQTMNSQDTVQGGPSEQSQGQIDQETIAQLRAQIAALTELLPTPENPVVRTNEPDTPATIMTTSDYSGPAKYSKKRPDPPVFTNGIDPTFESWKIQMQAKLRANADHYPTEEDKMEYLFSRTLGDAQKHLLPRFDEDSPIRFVSFREMLQHLASIYINPNKVRDAQYEYRYLRMGTGQTFATFQTRFLHLAGEGQIPQSSYRLDLFDKLPVYLQRMLLPVLDDFDTYEQLATRCLTLDTGLRRIEEMNPKRRSIRTEERPSTFTTTTPGTAKPITSSPQLRASLTPDRTLRQGTPLNPAVTCYNCQKQGHYASSCPEPRKTDLNALEEGISDDEMLKEEP